MHLFNLNEFGARYGIDLTVADFKDAVTEASKAATAGLASHLRYGSFEAFALRKDIFQCTRVFAAGNMQKLQLRLSRGFVNEDSVFTAYYATSPKSFRNNDLDLLTDLQAVNNDTESNYVYVDYQKGVLSVYGIDLTDQWVEVSYSGGLTTTASGQYKSVPEWLQEAAMLQAAIHLSRNRAFQTEGEDDTEFLKMSLKSMLGGNWRADPSAVLPMSTVV